jgi:hypothetical protein
MLRNARKKVTLKLTRNQLGVVVDALQNRFDFLVDFGSQAASERRAVKNLVDKTMPIFIESGK